MPPLKKNMAISIAIPAFGSMVGAIGAIGNNISGNKNDFDIGIENLGNNTGVLRGTGTAGEQIQNAAQGVGNIASKLNPVSAITKSLMQKNFNKNDIDEPQQIQDKTNENQEQSLNALGQIDKYIEFAKEQQEKNWAREDAIRKETQEREDNAWQRAVDDMVSAGVNPNLVNAGPASSGGGITQASDNVTGTYETAMTNTIQYLNGILERNLKGDENEKDRVNDSINKLMQLAGSLAIAYMYSKK